MKRWHEWNLVGMELQETWRRAKDLDGGRLPGARGDDNAGGDAAARSGRKGLGVGRAMNEENWPGLGRARGGLQGGFFLRHEFD